MRRLAEWIIIERYCIFFFATLHIFRGRIGKTGVIDDPLGQAHSH